MPRPQKQIEYRVNENGCHICISHYIDPFGYPKFKRNGKDWIMSRYIYTQNFGEIPKGLVIRHKCDNTGCINPEHLELGTVSENNKDLAIRFRASQGEEHKDSKLKEYQVVEIFKSKLPSTKLSKIYNVSHQSISNIRNNVTWKKITRHI